MVRINRYPPLAVIFTPDFSSRDGGTWCHVRSFIGMVVSLKKNSIEYEVWGPHFPWSGPYFDVLAIRRKFRTALNQTGAKCFFVFELSPHRNASRWERGFYPSNLLPRQKLGIWFVPRASPPDSVLRSQFSSQVRNLHTSASQKITYAPSHIQSNAGVSIRQSLYKCHLCLALP